MGTLGPLVLIVLLAALLRGWRVSEVGLDHFDEGVYAFSALALADPQAAPELYPRQARFSPPVFFGLTGALQRGLDVPTDRAAALLNAGLGALTVLAIGLVGSSWFGARAGVIAATLLAASEYHVALSRCALTDVPFALFHLLATCALVEALRRRSFALAVLAGAAVGLAWNTKYHGWLALVVTGVAALAALVFERPRSLAASVRVLAVGSVAALVAALCYLPWAMYVDSRPGGYAALAEYQAGMLSGSWWGNAWRQLQFQVFFEGPLSRASVPLAIVAGLAVGDGVAGLRGRRLAQLAFVAASSLIVGGSLTTMALAALGLRHLTRSASDLRPLTLAAWLGVWAVLTPFYYPYARLLLPWMIAVCLGAAVWISRWLDSPGAEPSAAEPSRATSLRWAGACALAVLVLARCLPDSSDPWRPSRGMHAAVQSILRDVPAERRILVLGEPCVLFYLHEAGRRTCEQMSAADLPRALASADAPVFVVAGFYEPYVGAEEGELSSARLGLRRVATYPVDVKDLRLLDDIRPRQAFSYRRRGSQRAHDLRLFVHEPDRRGG